MKTVVIIPCYNEALTIGKVVREFRRELPGSPIYVGDNNSTDDTATIAAEAGAIVVPVYRQGKGAAVRTLFREIDADIYVLVDGDDTYPASAVHKLIEPIIAGRADMTVGDRHTSGGYGRENKRPFHGLGNTFVTHSINLLFRCRLTDIMSGYRAFDRIFLKNFAVLTDGFELETAMTLHALEKRFDIIEVPIEYRDRPPNSFSKLRTFSDGFRVLRTILWLFKDTKPLIFFLFLSVLFSAASVFSGLPVVIEFMKTGGVHKLPSAIFACGLAVISGLMMTCGFILDTIVKLHRESYELQLRGGSAPSQDFAEIRGQRSGARR
jgi:glycosyltransferase involved in cell wall biosynthesis